MGDEVLDAFEFTLLKCLVHRGLVIDIEPVYRRIETNASGEELVEAVIEARQEVASEIADQPSL